MRSTLTRTLVDAATLATNVSHTLAQYEQNRQVTERDLEAIDARIAELLPASKAANPARRKVLRTQLLSLLRRKKVLLMRLDTIDKSMANVRAVAGKIGIDIDPVLEISPEELAPSALETVTIEDSDAEFEIADLLSELNPLIDDLRTGTIEDGQEEEYLLEFDALEEIVSAGPVSLEGINVGADG
jgi:hypothetical protein